MKHITFLFCIALLFASCGTARHVPHHGAMNKTGSKAQQDAQGRLSKQFGGANYKKPNHFKRRHFPKGFTGDLLRNLECPEYIPTACGDTIPICFIAS